MTREEAIQALNEIFDDSEFSRYESWYGTAMNMAIEALQGKPINCNYTCSDCVHQNNAYEEEPCHSCFNNDGAGYEPVSGRK